MERYNTQRPLMINRELGRHTQSLVAYAKGIPDREARQAAIEKIVKLIMSLHPDTRNIDDYRLKVWEHVLKMADYDLDVDIPEGVTLDKKDRRPELIPYPRRNHNMRYYGKNVQTLIDKAIDMEDPYKRNEFIAVILAYMKMSYTNWNRDHVSDETIMDEFEMLSEGRLLIPNNADLNTLTKPRRNNNNNNYRNNGGRNNNRNNGGRNNNNRNNNHKKYSRRRK